MWHRIIVIIICIVAFLSACAHGWMRNAEPALLEVRYMRSEVNDTLHRESSVVSDEMMLRIGRTKSMFCNVKRFFQDSLSKANPDAYWGMMKMEIDKGNPNVFATLGGHKRSFLYKDYTTDRIIEEDYFDMTPWRYTEKREKPVWDISQETKVVSGYECFKAVSDFRGRRWTAWFAPEIPVHEGPWKLDGLPGLILEAHDSNNDYVFKCCGIIQSGLGNVGFCMNRKSDDYINVTRDKFFNNWWRYKHSNFAAKIRAAYGVGPRPSPKENEPKVLSYDKEETDYPHDL